MSSTPQIIDVVGAAPGVTVEIVPGKKYVPLPPAQVRVVGVAELVPAGDGTFRAMVRICPQWFNNSEANLRRLSIAVSRSGMRRLVLAGFVEGMQVTPGVYQFDYDSFRRHEAATKDPEFWDRTEPGHKRTNRQRISAVVSA